MGTNLEAKGHSEGSFHTVLNKTIVVVLRLGEVPKAVGGKEALTFLQCGQGISPV
jgi:hypothetical protein